MINATCLRMVLLTACSIIGLLPSDAFAGRLRAGVAKVDVTNTEAGPVNDPLFVKALVIKDDDETLAIITVDAVAIGEIGHIRNDYLSKVRSRLEKELGIKPERVLVNASHCHGVVCADVDERTIQAVKQAASNLVPVNIGAGVGREDRIMENRRLRLRNGKEADVRHAYALPPDEEVVGTGPVDPEIGVLRLDREDGRTLAVVYNFACHPIMGVPNGGNTADVTGFASHRDRGQPERRRRSPCSSRGAAATSTRRSTRTSTTPEMRKPWGTCWALARCGRSRRSRARKTID